MTEFYKKEDVIDFLNLHCPKDMWEYQIADLNVIGASEDCISRQQAIEALTGWETEPLDEDIIRTLENLPTIEVSEDCISRQAAVEAVREKLQDWGGYTNEDYRRGLYEAQDLISALPPVTPTEQNEEDILKFYYVESLDEYWIGQRCGTRYYGKWTGNCFTFGYSRYLPWGEHVVEPDTLWKEHTYPSEPKEIPFNEWLQGFLEKGRPTERTGEEKKIQTIKVEPSESFHNKIRWMRIKTRILKRKAKEREEFLRRMRAK